MCNCISRRALELFDQRTSHQSQSMALMIRFDLQLVINID